MKEDNQPHNLGIIFFPAYDWSIAPTHPEREERLLYTHDLLREQGIFDLPGIKEFKTGIATNQDLLKVHFFPLGIDKVVAAPHLISAGGALAAGRLFAEKKAKKAFALVRPPGHHARKVVHGGRGFCNINNVAIMVESLRTDYGYRRVAIVDTDCHHGDGTQDIYWFDPDTMYISLHQDGRTLYPGTGFVQEMGGPNAWGTTINVPLPPETGDEGFLLATTNVILPILKEWKPDLIVNSAGQDNHFSDPITNMLLTAKGYAEMVSLIDADIAVLEGGYSIQSALPYTNMAIILTMAGLDGTKVTEPWPERMDKSSLKTRKQNLDRISNMAEEIYRRRKKKPERDQFDMKLEKGFFKRRRKLFYDNHPLKSSNQSDPWPGQINEVRKEYLRNCEDCPGVLIIKTSSELAREQYFVQLPHEPCDKCLSVAEEVWSATVPFFFQD